jgi:hypothetical protein
MVSSGNMLSKEALDTFLQEQAAPGSLVKALRESRAENAALRAELEPPADAEHDSRLIRGKSLLDELLALRAENVALKEGLGAGLDVVTYLGEFILGDHGKVLNAGYLRNWTRQARALLSPPAAEPEA